jgi:hypothetical protein
MGPTTLQATNDLVALHGRGMQAIHGHGAWQAVFQVVLSDALL